MSQRRLDAMKWALYFLALSAGPVWRPVNSVTVRTPVEIPSTIEAQAKFFQDFFSVQLSPYKIEFGHVCEDPNTWEQRYERKDFKNHRDMGKVRWGDKQGGYGEHYWDLNHAGHAGNHENDDYDDGSYREDTQENNRESGDQSGKYEYVEHHPDEASQYDESGRTKRANSNGAEDSYRQEKPKQKRLTENTDEFKIKNGKVNKDDNDIDLKLKTEAQLLGHDHYSKKTPIKREILYDFIDRNINDNYEVTAKSNERKHYAPYEGGAGARQRLNREVASPSVSRLFLEPSTGHVIDRATGQAYVLQPVHLVNRYS